MIVRRRCVQCLGVFEVDEAKDKKQTCPKCRSKVGEACVRFEAFSSVKNDEYYTPTYAIVPLLPYLKRFKTIWCPFDTAQSNFVDVLQNDGHEVIYTHISNGEDFFQINLECDAIVSNPPYSLKNEVLEKLFAIGK